MQYIIPSILALATNIACQNTTSVSVKLSTGTYNGLIDTKYPNTRQFRAIPFAQPPVGQLRWAPPQKLSPSPDEQRFSKRFPPSCPQFITSLITLFNTDLTKGNLIYNGNQNDTSGLVGEATSEDCLYVAVWTPTAAPPPGGFPVLFFMTGGGFITGGVDIPWQNPVSWVERSQSHIVVTINYRLNIFGFPSARGLPTDHLNLGILDQRAALEWTRDNIAAFGGNPKRITQWGRSAGASATDFHAYAFKDDPIAQGYYIQSGAINLAGKPGPSFSNFTYVASNVGCGGYEDDPEQELACMRQVPMAMIENFYGQAVDRGILPVLSFQPVNDNHVIFNDYETRIKAGMIARVPTLLSATANEASSLVPWPIDDLAAGPNQTLVTYYTVAAVVCPTYNSTVYRGRLGIPVYRMQYAGQFPNLNKYGWLGAYHASDIVIPFGTYNILDFLTPTTPFEVEVSHAFQDHLLAFVKDPLRGPQELGWNPANTSDPSGGDLIRIGAQGKAVQHINSIEVDGVCVGMGEYDPFP